MQQQPKATNPTKQMIQRSASWTMSASWNLSIADKCPNKVNQKNFVLGQKKDKIRGSKSDKEIIPQNNRDQLMDAKSFGASDLDDSECDKSSSSDDSDKMTNAHTVERLREMDSKI